MRVHHCVGMSTQALYVNEVSGRVLARYVKGKDEGDRKLMK